MWKAKLVAAAAQSQTRPFWALSTRAALPQTLHLEESGLPGRNIVFIPGLGGTTRYWRGHLGRLEQNYQTILVDPLGFGDSPKPWMRYTIETHVEALHQVLNESAPFLLVGHSMGALLSIAYAARYPEQVEGLVLVSLPYYESQKKAVHTVRRSSPLYRVFLGNIALAVIICVLTRRVFGWLVPYLQPDLPREVAVDIVKHSWRSFTSSLWEVIYHYDVKYDADRLSSQIPVICIHGDRDPIAPLENAQALACGRPNWRVQILPGVDHHPFFRTPDVCLRAIETVMTPPEDAINHD
ncbi:MAG: alpha/beta hydrolase [Chloroflexi bacterium]|nr:alpha/beta hydrolase [Chloroflexota bacterium]